MARDLHLPIEIVPCPTVREGDGLACSSRNRYLSAQERQAAPILWRALRAGEQVFLEGERGAKAILARVKEVIAGEPLASLQYAELRDAETLEEVSRIERPAVLALAARLGRTRLIDNLVLKVG
jgi:pantoate--beta-alanine ligase